MPARKTSATSSAANTGHEAQYLKSLADRQIRVEIKLRDGERLHGWIEYFDDNMVRLTRDGAPNLFVYKHHIHSIAEGPKPRSTSNGRVSNGAGKPA